MDGEGTEWPEPEDEPIGNEAPEASSRCSCDSVWS